jgi:fructose-bisphosphate aldolase class I
MTGAALTARQLVSSGRGILAVDQGKVAMNARLAAAGAPATDASRRVFREVLVTTPGLVRGVSGVLLSDETFRHCLSDGRPFPQALAEAGLLAGVRADTGVRPLGGNPDETITEGLDGLRARLGKYVSMGARFAAWRAVFRIGPGQPSWAGLRANAHSLARYASLCLELNLVPVVELRIPATGEHTIERSHDVTSAALFTVVAELWDLEVGLDAVVFQVNMVDAGTDFCAPVPAREVAARTITALTGLVPRESAGVALTAGPRPPRQATAALAEICRLGPAWPVAFSFDGTLTDAALAAWRGDPRHVRHAQRALANRVACNVAALQGTYVTALEHSYVLV